MKIEEYIEQEDGTVLYRRTFFILTHWLTMEIFVTKTFLETTPPEQLESYYVYCVEALRMKHNL